MIHAIADTHGLIWYLTKSPRLSKEARETFDHAGKSGLTIGVSAISIVEIVYLIEKGRIAEEALELLKSHLLADEPLLEIVPLSFAIADMLSHISRDTAPDMPDRIIAATALFMNVPLISRDRQIKLSQIETIW